MNRDQIEGGFRNIRGRGRTALGALGGKPGPQVEGAYEQVAGIAQSTYGRARERAEDLQRDGREFVEDAREHGRAFRDDATERGRAFRDEAVERGQHYRREVNRRGRAVVARADENRVATLALVALGAFGLGWLISRSR